MKPLGKAYKDATASSDFERLAAGGYVIRITGVTNQDDKEYLKVVYDIAEGPEAGRYKDEKPENDYRHSFVRSYKEKALGMFKAFIQAVDETNGTKFNDRIEQGFNEQTLVGKTLGVVFGYEEYEANDGDIKQRLYLKSCMSADRIRKGDFKVPELKKLKKEQPANSPVPGFQPLNDEDVPFD